MSIFKRTNNLSGENTSTEILAYFLESGNNFIPFQKLFFQKIFDKPYSSTQLNTEIATQVSFPEGKPDIIMITEDSLIFVENKLSSHLSGDDQLIKYAQIFDNLKNNQIFSQVFPLTEINKIKNKYLILIAPQSIITASIKITKDIIAKRYKQTFYEFFDKRYIIFKTISWEEILQDLDISNPLQNELSLYVKEYIKEGITMEEKKLLYNEEIPIVLLKLFDLMFKIRDSVDVSEFKVGRMSQSCHYFGFNIEHKSLSIFFGYFLPLWSHYRTPIFVQIREANINEKRDQIIKFLKTKNFEKDPNQEYILPFKVDAFENWSLNLNNFLHDLENNL